MIKKLIILVLISTVLAGCGLTASQKSGVSQTSEYVKGAVVKGFPNLPLFPGAKVVETYGQDRQYGGTFITGDNLAKVVDFYSKSLGVAGWQSTLAQKSASNYVFTISNSQQVGEVIVNTAADGKKTAITMSVESR